MAVRKGGVETVISGGEAGVRFDKWLASSERLRSRSRASHALLHGQVFLNDVEQTVDAGARRLEVGDRVRVWVDRPRSAARRGRHTTSTLAVVFEDADLIVLDKPAGVPTVPIPDQPTVESLADRVEEHWRSHGREPMAVHRLDRDTSGLVVFARSGVARARLKAQFMARTPERRYLAIVSGVPSPPTGEWRIWMTWDPHTRRQRLVDSTHSRAYEAISRYAVREVFGTTQAAALDVALVTGKRHQIRVQAWHAGHPLVGERMYIDPARGAIQPSAFERQALHAYRLGFSHPQTGERLLFESPVPPDLVGLQERLRRLGDRAPVKGGAG